MRLILQLALFLIPAGAAHYEIVMAPDSDGAPPEPRDLA